MFERRWMQAACVCALVFAAGWGCTTAKPKAEEPQTVMFSPPPNSEEVPPLPGSGAVLERDSSEEQVVALTEEPEGAVATGASRVVRRNDVRELVRRGPGWALGQVRVKPARQGDQFMGFQVESFSDDAQGVVSPPLEAGDVITHLMGVRLKSPDDYMAAWNMMRGAETLRIDYVRQGSPLFTEWTIQD